ncbi:MAG TPA: hypothetical protein VFM88_00165 [Vicinamibacteria bacterium]|nr:hypothetical protein [Vicinamibacteria bacterium]
MKHMENGGFQGHPLMRATIGLTLSLLMAFWITNFAMYFGRMGLTSRSVVAYYNGSEEEFRPPRSAASMLETTHAHLPMMGMVLLFLTHLAIFAPIPRGAKVGLIGAAFVSAVLDEGGGWLVRFVSPALAPVKIGGFVGLQAAIAALLLVLAAFLLGAARRQAAQREGEEPGKVESLAEARAVRGRD